MNLETIRNGSTILLDTNILIYARRGASRQAVDLLTRCRAEAVTGVITSFVVAEFCHRRMMQESQSMGFVRSNPARSLGGKPNLVRQLSQYADDTRGLLAGVLDIVHTETADFAVALELQKQFGLMTLDSLTLAMMRRLGIHEIATADTNFDHVQGVIVYKPDDLIT